MGKTVLGVFNSQEDAEKAASELQRKGFSRSEISIVTKEGGGRESRGGRGRRDSESMSSDVTDGITTGGAIGGAAGLLTGVGALAVPGIGPLLAAGPIAATLGGAVTGGVAGGLIDWGIPEESGRHYEDRVREGKVVAAVRTDEGRTQEAALILRQNGAYDVETH